MPNKIVYPYNEKNLCQVLANGAYRGKPAPSPLEIHGLSRLDPVTYLHGYLNKFCSEEDFAAKTIAVEEHYVDRDYLTDYAGYYSTAFQHVEKKTTRLHFFSCTVAAADFDAALTGDEGQRKKLQDGYLGFVVVRPMPKNFMGRTCLKHYPRTKSEPKGEVAKQAAAVLKETRHYTVLREYVVDLFGIRLTVETIAFQEQDSVVGACASAALYALLHGVKPLYDTPTYSALEITQIANGFSAPTGLTSPSTRSLPNTGLSFGQMYQTLGELDMSPTMVSIAGDRSHQADAIANLYAYLSGGLPVLAHVALVPLKLLEDAEKDCGSSEELHERVRSILFEAEKHAFTIAGYSLMEEADAPLDVSDGTVRLDEVARRVNKLYIHCDRIGPFAKFWMEPKAGWLTLRPDALKRGEPDSEGKALEELAYQGIGENTLAVPIVFIVPTSEKLRLSFDNAYEVAEAIEYSWPEALEVVWDIKVADIRTLRAEWLASKLLGKREKLEALTFPLPRFCWRIIAMLKGAKDPMFEVLLDCTAVDAANSILNVVTYSLDGQLTLMAANTQLRSNYRALRHVPNSAINPRIMSQLLKVFDAHLMPPTKKKS